MIRFHVHLNVADLAGSLPVYRELFGAKRAQPDHAKWMLDHPRAMKPMASSATSCCPPQSGCC